MMNTLVETDLFICFGVGAQVNVSVSHLQFVDDTLLRGLKVGPM